MTDLVARLNEVEELKIPPGTRIDLDNGSTLILEEGLSLWFSSSDKQDAAAEIQRLRARIQKLECALQPLADLYLWPDDLGEEASLAIKSDANWCESSNADADVSEGLRRGHIHAARLVLKDLP